MHQGQRNVGPFFTQTLYFCGNWNIVVSFGLSPSLDVFSNMKPCNEQACLHSYYLSKYIAVVPRIIMKSSYYIKIACSTHITLCNLQIVDKDMKIPCKMSHFKCIFCSLGTCWVDQLHYSTIMVECWPLYTKNHHRLCWYAMF